MSGQQQRRRDRPPPYPGLAWTGRYDDSATHRPRLLDSGYPLRWQGVDGQPETWSARWIESGLPVAEGEHAVFDRWQGHRVVADGLSAAAAIALAERLEIEQQRCGQRPALCWECRGEVLIRGVDEVALCPGCQATWRLAEVDPCPWPASEEGTSPKGPRLPVCRSHAALWAQGDDRRRPE